MKETGQLSQHLTTVSPQLSSDSMTVKPRHCQDDDVLTLLLLCCNQILYAKSKNVHIWYVYMML